MIYFLVVPFTITRHQQTGVGHTTLDLGDIIVAEHAQSYSQFMWNLDAKYRMCFHTGPVDVTDSELMLFKINNPDATITDEAPESWLEYLEYEKTKDDEVTYYIGSEL